MDILAASGVYWGETAPSEHLRAVPRTEKKKTTAPVSAYALEAVAGLGLDLPKETGLAIVCGPTGSLVNAFDRAWQKSGDARLTGTDFAKTRYRRIHPFTLIPSLQNQVAASLSMELGLTGPCMNSISGETGLAYLLPSVAAMLTRTSLVLLVVASAGNRGEEALKLKAMGREGRCEGAAAFLIGRDGGRGCLRLSDAPTTSKKGTPILGAAFALLDAFAEKRGVAVSLIDGDHRATINYQRKEES
jgi:hypothetical protein